MGSTGLALTTECPAMVREAKTIELVSCMLLLKVTSIRKMW